MSRRMKRSVSAGCILMVGTVFVAIWGTLSVIMSTFEQWTTDDSDSQMLFLHRFRRSLPTNETLSKNESRNATEICTPASILQFPRPLMTKKTLLKGGLVIHFVVCLYMFMALAIICDEYFVPSLECICEALNIPSDVSGATFMAAGSSAPELATAIIGVFVSKNDIGIGTVVGSAVYNIAFVVGICGLFAGQTIHLKWWPMVRDSFVYTLSIVALLLTIYDGRVTWVEAVIMLVMYALYITFMAFNSRVENWITSKCHGKKRKVQINHSTPINSTNSVPSVSSTIMSSSDPIWTSNNNKPVAIEVSDKKNGMVFQVPEGNCFRKTIWVLSIPVFCCTYFTIPDCRNERWKKWYLATFLSSCIWISAQSYVLVWMITVIGTALDVPDTVMGLTFLAAGVSVPDAIASLLVARDGFGDMAISNAVGSNVFDILLCLGLPWLMETAFVSPGSTIEVYSKGLIYSTITLLSTVVFLLAATHLNGWRLNKRYGVVMMVWYIGFMCVASLYELNVFGVFNPPVCPYEM